MAKKGRPAAIVGHFVNYKPVLGRDVLTLVIEVPSVAAAQVFAALGYPTGGVSIPVAVARLEESASVAKPLDSAVGGCQEPSSAEVQRPDLAGVPPGPQTAESEEANRKLVASINAKTRHLKAMGEAIDDETRERARLHGPPVPAKHWSMMTPAQQTGVIRNERDFWAFAGVESASEARNYIRVCCHVESCADILQGTEAAARWAQLQVRYGNWLRQRRGAA